MSTDAQIDPAQKSIGGLWYFPDSLGYRIALEREIERLTEELAVQAGKGEIVTKQNEPHILQRAVFQCPSVELAKEILANPIVDAHPWDIAWNPSNKTLTTCVLSADQANTLQAIAAQYNVALTIDNPLDLHELIPEIEALEVPARRKEEP